jgi:hypothetical protein
MFSQQMAKVHRDRKFVEMLSPSYIDKPDKHCLLNNLLRANFQIFIRANRGRSFCLTGDKPSFILFSVYAFNFTVSWTRAQTKPDNIVVCRLFISWKVFSYDWGYVMPLTVAARSKAWLVFSRSNAGIVVRVPLGAWMSVCAFILCLCCSACR